MYNQLTPSELAQIRTDIERSEADCVWFLELLSRKGARSNEIENKNEKGQESLLPGQQCLSA